MVAQKNDVVAVAVPRAAGAYRQVIDTGDDPMRLWYQLRFLLAVLAWFRAASRQQNTDTNAQPSNHRIARHAADYGQ